MFTLFDQERETQLYHERLERRLTEEITKRVTEQVTAEVSDKVTAKNVEKLMASRGFTCEQAIEVLGVATDDRERITAIIAS